MFSFLHRPIVLLHKISIATGATGIHFVFLTLKVPVALHFMNYQGPHFQLKIALLKKKNGWPESEKNNSTC